MPRRSPSCNDGEIPIHEAGLEAIVREEIETGRLRFITDTTAVRDREFIYLCVPTPQGPDGSADMSYIDAAARQIAPHLNRGSVVVNKSTVPVGSTRLVEHALTAHRCRRWYRIPNSCVKAPLSAIS